MKVILIVSSLVVIFITSFIAIKEILKSETKREKLLMLNFFLTPPVGADMVHFFYWLGLLGLAYSVFFL